MNEAPNLIFIKQLSDGDIAFETKLLEVLKRELPQEIEVYKTYYNHKEFEKSADIVHKIKHKISILGLINSHKLTANYEDQLREGDHSKHQKFVNILEVMTTFLNQH